MSEETKQGLADAAHPAELLEELECAVKELKKHPTLLAAARQLRERATTSEGIDKETLDSMERMERQLGPLVKALDQLAKLQKIVDDLDPHTISEVKFKKWWSKSTKEIIQDAAVSGRFRERRIILQAKEAETNRKLARIAFIAAMIALAGPLIVWGWKLAGVP
jgi:hypothetical protein